MNLGFNEIFIPKIISGSKIHTIRKDSFNRWGAGKLIHICTGLKTKEYKLHIIKDCVSVQRFDIFWSWSEELNKNIHNIFVDKIKMLESQIQEIATNDGFENVEDFLSQDSWNNKHFTGRLIHWTSKKY